MCSDRGAPTASVSLPPVACSLRAEGDEDRGKLNPGLHEKWKEIEAIVESVTQDEEDDDSDDMIVIGPPMWRATNTKGSKSN